MLQEALKEDDYTAQREQVLKVEGECAKEKKEGLEQLDEERVSKIEAEKKAIRDKFTIGAKDEEEIRQQLIDLMASGKDNYEAVMR